jgi:hypothetical protein
MQIGMNIGSIIIINIVVVVVCRAINTIDIVSNHVGIVPRRKTAIATTMRLQNGVQRKPEATRTCGRHLTLALQQRRPAVQLAMAPACD